MPELIETEPTEETAPAEVPEYPKTLAALAEHIKGCKQSSEGQHFREKMVLRVKEHREQHDKEYRLKQQLQFADSYECTIASGIETIQGTRLSALQTAQDIAKVEPTKARIADETQAAWAQIQQRTDMLKSMAAYWGMDPEVDVSRDKWRAYVEAQRKLDQQALLQELRLADVARLSGIEDWYMESFWRAAVDGTVILTLDWMPDDDWGKPTVRVIDPLRYYPSNSNLQKLDDQAWRIEESKITGSDLRLLAELYDAEAGGQYRYVDEVIENGATTTDTEASTEATASGLAKEYDRYIFIGALDFPDFWKEEDLEGDDWRGEVKRQAEVFGWDYDEAQDLPHHTWYVEVIGEKVVRFQPTPYTFSKFPDVVFAMRRMAEPNFWGFGFYDWGASEVEKLRNFMLQLTAQMLWQQSEPERMVDKQFFAGRQRSLMSTGEILRFSPGKVIDGIPTTGNVQNAVRELKPDPTAIQMAQAHSDHALMREQALTKATPSLQGNSRAGTATEAQLNLQQGLAGIGAPVQNFDSQLAKPVLANLYRMAKTRWPIQPPVALPDGTVMQADYDFREHSFQIIIIEEAANKALMAQVVNNIAGTLGPFLNRRWFVKQQSRNLQSRNTVDMLDEQAMDNYDKQQRLMGMQLDVQIKQAKAQMMMDAAQQMMMGMQQQGQIGANEGDGQSMMGEEQQPRLRSRSAPTSENDMQTQALSAGTTRKMIPDSRA